MSINELFKIRPTGILIEDDKILIVRQKVNDARSWSLPGESLSMARLLKKV